MATITALGEAIKAHRARYGQTQAKLADEMRVSRSWVAGIENGKTYAHPDPIFVARAANYLRLPRRQVFAMAGYTAGEILDLFGVDNVAAESVPDDLVTRLARIEAGVAELRSSRATTPAASALPSPELMAAMVAAAAQALATVRTENDVSTRSRK